MSKVWVLTREINQYDQDGRYFEAVFIKKPDLKTLAEVFYKRGLDHGSVDLMAAVAFLDHVRGGGGRRENENEWFNLEEIEAH